jgi:hypothetical protein
VKIYALYAFQFEFLCSLILMAIAEHALLSKAFFSE